MKKIIFIFICIFMLIFFVSCITTYVVYSGQSFTTIPTEYYIGTGEFSWPLAEYHTISSNFGFRIHPTTGYSSYHSGIDIPAPERNKDIFCIKRKSYLSRF